MTRDRRADIITGAITSETLSPAQKLLIITAATLAPEYVDGKLRHGSKAMGPDGHFALHYDYLGKALGISAKSAKRMAERLAKPERSEDGKPKHPRYLDKVHPGTFGRPATWHAFVVRGDRKREITVRLPVTPYGSEHPTTRGGNQSPLTYKTPDHPDHNGAHAADGDPRSPEGQRGEAEGHAAAARLAAAHPQPDADREVI